MRTRNGQVIRQWQLLRLLAEHPRRVPELASLCDVTRRSVYRDLHALRDAGFAIGQHTGGAWSLQLGPDEQPLLRRDGQTIVETPA